MTVITTEISLFFQRKPDAHGVRPLIIKAIDEYILVVLTKWMKINSDREITDRKVNT